jgi:nucleolar complex protein 3
LKLRLVDLEKLDAMSRDSKAFANSRAGLLAKTQAAQRAKKAAKLFKNAAEQSKGRSIGGGGGEGPGGMDDEQDIAAGLKTADAENLADRRKYAESTLKRVIAIYFRILRAPSHAYLLPDALNGLSRFSHLIDVGVVSDLLLCLRETLAASMDQAGLGAAAEDEEDGHGAGAQQRVGPQIKLSLPSALNSVLTALRIMAGPGSVLNADDTQFAHYLYMVLLKVAASGGAQYASTAVYAVQALLVNRREYSNDRVAAFVKRCLTVALTLPVPTCLAMITMARTIAHRYPAARGLDTCVLWSLPW